MKKILLLSLMSGLMISNNLFANACDDSSPEEISSLYGIAARDVKEQSTYQRKTTSECTWSFKNSSGQGIDIAYRTFDKTPKITNPKFFENNQKYLVDHGKKIGKMELTYQFHAFPNTQHGIISDIYGNRFTKSLHYGWIKDEQRRLGVTLSNTINDKGEIAQPTVDELRKIVEIFSD